MLLTLRLLPFVLMVGTALALLLSGDRRKSWGRPSFVALAALVSVSLLVFVVRLMPLTGSIEVFPTLGLVFDSLAQNGSLGLALLVLLVGTQTALTNEGRLLLSREKVALWLVGLASLLLVMMTGHLLVVILGWVVFAAVLFGLISVADSNLRTLEAGAKIFITAIAVITFFGLGCWLLFSHTGTLFFPNLGALDVSGGMPLASVGVLLVSLGFAVGLGLFPFHFWIVDSWQALPPAWVGTLFVGFRLAMVLVWVRLLDGALHFASPQVIGWMVWFGFVTSLCVLFLFFRQRNLARREALWTVAALSDLILVFSVSKGNPAGVLLVALVQALASGTMLTLRSSLRLMNTGDVEVSHLAGVIRHHPVVAVTSLFGWGVVLFAGPFWLLVGGQTPWPRLVAFLLLWLIKLVFLLSLIMQMARGDKDIWLGYDEEIRHWACLLLGSLALVVVIAMVVSPWFTIPWQRFVPVPLGR